MRLRGAIPRLLDSLAEHYVPNLGFGDAIIAAVYVFS